ncbi:hypothetical protein [Gimesia algae]|uniref:DUF3299 domain-containing protein n=1 Tax=Gimesia algae TaxID=2527971 RepID=A0A517V6Q7_9PLAN|nr:hypothetical protein [Gimesia algae]QDT88688.1 hypothetical protein Pan161_03060 [Gimesia algae]
MQPPDHQEIDHVQAHLNPTRPFIFTLTIIVLSSLSVFVSGCSSSDSTDYRQFSEQIDHDRPQSDSTPAKATAEVTPEQQPAEPVAQVETSTTVAVKPAVPAPPSEQTTAAAAKSDSASLKSGETLSIDTSLPVVAQRPDPKKRALTDEEVKQEKRASEPREVKILVKERSFRRTSPENALLVNYDDLDLLKIMNMEPVTPEAPELMPEWLKNLDGKRIRIRGFMYPPFQQSGNEYFLLARDNQICCFGKNPKIYDLFPVIMREGVTADYILNRPFDVVGVFHINAESFDGELERIYTIDDAIVIDK